eukprot:jgi/Mesvir1/21514/Mv03957-RA.1
MVRAGAITSYIRLTSYNPGRCIFIPLEDAIALGCDVVFASWQFVLTSHCRGGIPGKANLRCVAVFLAVPSPVHTFNTPSLKMQQRRVTCMNSLIIYLVVVGSTLFYSVNCSMTGVIRNSTVGCAPSELPGYSCSLVVREGRLKVHWETFADMETDTVRIAAETPGLVGYLGVGWSASGSMIPGYAVIGWLDEPRPDTAVVKGYFLKAKKTSGVIETSDIPFVNRTISYVDGVTRLEVALRYMPNGGRSCPLCRLRASGDTKFNYAYTFSYITPRLTVRAFWLLAEHSGLRVGGRPSSCTPTTATSPSTSSTRSPPPPAAPPGPPTSVFTRGAHMFDNDAVAHGLAMIAAFALMFPLAVSLAANARQGGGLLKQAAPIRGVSAWFQWHRVLNSIGAGFVVVGLAIAISEFDIGRIFSEHARVNRLHAVCGIFFGSLALLNLLVGLLRPAKESLSRPRWLKVHLYCGRGTVIGGIITCFLGILAFMKDDDESSALLWVCYILFLAVSALVHWRGRARNKAAGGQPAPPTGVVVSREMSYAVGIEEVGAHRLERNAGGFQRFEDERVG